jgi:hypothetical protein
VKKSYKQEQYRSNEEESTLRHFDLQREKKASSRYQKPFDRLVPLSARDIIVGQLTRPCNRYVSWRPEEENEALTGTRVPDLLVELSRFFRGIAPNGEHEEIVETGSPKKSRGRDLFSFMHLDCVTSQDGSARLARSLAAVDEENFFVGKSRAATKWWAIHMTLPKRRVLFRAGDSDKVCAERVRESTENMKGVIPH